MNSDSQTPAVGLELGRRRTKPEIERAEHVTPPRMNETSAEPAGSSDGSRFSKWARWLNPLSSPKRITIPRTDLSEDEPESATEPEEIGTDF